MLGSGSSSSTSSSNSSPRAQEVVVCPVIGGLLVQFPAPWASSRISSSSTVFLPLRRKTG